MNSQLYRKTLFEVEVSKYKFEIEFNADGAVFDIRIYKTKNYESCCHLLNLSINDSILPLVQNFFIEIYEHLLLCSQLIEIYRRCECVETILGPNRIQIPQLPFHHKNSIQFLLDNIHVSFSRFIVLLHSSRFSTSTLQSYVRGILNDITYLNWACQLHAKIKYLHSIRQKQSDFCISKTDVEGLRLKGLILQLVNEDKMSFLRLFNAEFLNGMKSSSPSVQSTLDRISRDLFFPPSQL